MASIKLKTLFQDLDVKIYGPMQTEIKGLCLNSKLVKPSDLFVATKGSKEDGSLFIEEAIASGASAILCDLYNPFLNTPQIVCKNPSHLLPLLAKKFYKDPSSKLSLVGITGTSGKTTTAYLTKHLLQDTGLLGTIEYIIKDHVVPAHLTTPDILTVYKYLSEMAHKDLAYAVMEVSSHALDQGRVEGLDFSYGVFTNLSHEHLDYHKTMDEYVKAKAKLMGLSHKACILNLDDPYYSIMKSSAKAKVFSYSLEKKADLFAKDIKMSLTKMSFTLCYKDKEIEMTSPLIGKFNLYNILAALSICILEKMPFATLQERLKTFPSVKGRLEKIKVRKKIHAFVDFAHKEDALKQVLETLYSVKKGKIITVFGCGGDRDKEKRPRMGKVAEKYSDLVILTNDNPRTEDPVKIVEEIEKGFSCKKKPLKILDRKLAIEKALELAEPNDIVLVAGKGHETKQIFKMNTVVFSDRDVLAGA